MNNKANEVPKSVSDKVDKIVQNKIMGIIELKEKIDKRYGTYRPEKYKVEVITNEIDSDSGKNDETKTEGGQTQDENNSKQ